MVRWSDQLTNKIRLSDDSRIPSVHSQELEARTRTGGGEGERRQGRRARGQVCTSTATAYSSSY